MVAAVRAAHTHTPQRDLHDAARIHEAGHVHDRTEIRSGRCEGKALPTTFAIDRYGAAVVAETFREQCGAPH